MSALSDASIIRGDDPESERHVYKRLLELFEPDEEGFYPDPRADGFFEEHPPPYELDATEFKIIGDKIALCLASYDMRSFKAFGFINGDEKRRRFACSASGKQSTSQHGALPLRNTDSVSDRNNGKKCPAEFEFSKEKGFISKNKEHACLVHFATELEFRTDTLIVQQSLSHAKQRIARRIEDQALNLQENPGKNRNDLRREVRNFLAEESSLRGPVNIPSYLKWRRGGRGTRMVKLASIDYATLMVKEG